MEKSILEVFCSVASSASRYNEWICMFFCRQSELQGNSKGVTSND